MKETNKKYGNCFKHFQDNGATFCQTDVGAQVLAEVRDDALLRSWLVVNMNLIFQMCCVANVPLSDCTADSNWMYSARRE